MAGAVLCVETAMTVVEKARVRREVMAVAEHCVGHCGLLQGLWVKWEVIRFGAEELGDLT